MKTKMSTKWLALILMLSMIVSSFVLLPTTVSAAQTYERCFNRMKISDEAGYDPTSGKDYDGSVNFYDNVLCYLDIDFLVEKFSEDLSTLKEYSLDVKVAAYNKNKLDQSNYSSLKYYGMGESTYGGAVESDYYNGDIIAKNNAYKTVLTHSNYKNSNALPVMKNGDVVVSWQKTTGGVPGIDYTYFLDVRIKGNRNGTKGTYDVEKEWRFRITTYSGHEGPIVYGYDAPVHGEAFDTDVTCDIGECVSIKYYSYDDLMNKGKFTEVTKAVAGERGVAEFTIVKPHTDFEMYLSGIENYNDKLNWDVTTSISIRYTGIMNYSSPDQARWWESSDTVIDINSPVCKFYAIYTVSDNAKYVIKQGTINFTVPEDGATADSKVTLANVKKVFTGKGTRTAPQFTASNATWLTIDSKGKLRAVSSFSAGKSYIALVKLKPYGNYYFNEDSAKALSVPGASKATIGYMKSSDYDYVKEDGYYLAATFTKVAAKYCDININYEKSEMTASQNSAAYLTALSSVDLAGATDVEVKWYWSKDITKDNVGEVCSASSGDLKLQLDTSAVGTSYYKCAISCKMNGLESRIKYPSTEWVKVTVTEKASNPLALSAVGKQSVSLTKEGQSATFEVAAKNTNGTVNYSWYECDASGKLVDDVVIGTSKKLVISTIDGSYGDTYYYKCVARDSKGSDSLIFVVTVHYEKDISIPTISPTDTSTPETNGPNIIIPDTNSPDTGTPDTTDPETNVPESTGSDTGEADSTGTDTIDSGSKDFDSNKPEQSDSLDGDKSDGGMPVWLIIVIIVAILAVGATVVVIIIKKKNNKNK